MIVAGFEDAVALRDGVGDSVRVDETELVALAVRDAAVEGENEDGDEGLSVKDGVILTERVTDGVSVADTEIVTDTLTEGDS